VKILSVFSKFNASFFVSLTNIFLFIDNRYLINFQKDTSKYIYQTKINKHKNSNGSYSFFDYVKKMSYYFRYNEQINIIYNYKYIFGVPTFLYVYVFVLYSVFSRIFICLFLLKNCVSAISMHPTAISVPSRDPNAFT
jgi:hypothetical protein